MLENGDIVDFSNQSNTLESITAEYKIILESNFLPEFTKENIYILLFSVLGFLFISVFSFLSKNKK